MNKSEKKSFFRKNPGSFREGLKNKQVHRLFKIIFIISFVVSLAITIAITIGGQSKIFKGIHDSIKETPAIFILVFLVIFFIAFLLICWIEDMLISGFESPGMYALFCFAGFFCALTYVAIPLLILCTPFDLVLNFRAFGQSNDDKSNKDKK